MSQLKVKDTIHVERGVIHFKGYEDIKAQAEEVAEIIRSTDVTEDSIKHAKKLLASANKAVRDLEDRRITIKREMLAPYEPFEAKVKEIVSIVKEADKEVRDQVRHLEEMEREKREEDLRELWDLRMRPYVNLLKFLTFEDWLTPQHLNKSNSLNKVEEDMVKWLDTKAMEVKVIKGMEGSLEILAEFKSCLDMSLAIKTVQDRYKAQELIKETVEPIVTKAKSKVKQTFFVVEDETQAKLAEMVLNEYNINYKKEIR